MAILKDLGVSREEFDDWLKAGKPSRRP